MNTENLRLMVRIKANLPIIGRYRPGYGHLRLSVETLTAGIFEDGNFVRFEEVEVTNAFTSNLKDVVEPTILRELDAYRANEAVDAYGKAECPGEHKPELLVEQALVGLPEKGGVQRFAKVDLLLLKRDVAAVYSVHNATPTDKTDSFLEEAMTNNAELGMEIAATKVATRSTVHRAMARMQTSDPMTEPPPAPPIG
jgi:hypothetical protein